MSRFYPDSFLRTIFPKSFYTKNLVNQNFGLTNIAKKYLLKARAIAGGDLNVSVLNTLNQYADRWKHGDETKTEVLNDNAQLIHRVEDTVVYSEVQDLRDKHEGQYYRWLPSGAETPDPEHQLLYGKVFKVGEGDKDGNMPGERYGCRCGMEFLDEAADGSEPYPSYQVRYKEGRENAKRNAIKYETVTDDLTNDLQKQGDAVFEKLSVKEKEAIKDYTNQEYGKINAILAGKRITDRYTKMQIMNIETSMKNFNLDRNITLFKGTIDDYYTSWNVGEIKPIDIFMSTSTSKEKAMEITRFTNALYQDENAALLEIKTPKGTQGLYIGRNSGMTHSDMGHKEKELLLMRRLNYKMISKKTIKNEVGKVYNHIVLEVVKDAK